MKKLAGLLILLSMYALPSHALVRMISDCKTSDQQYRVTIVDNQGIGFPRTSHYGAMISDVNGNEVGSYALASNEGQPKSASFGRDMFYDIQTQGQEFSLSFPSTNYRHTSLLAHLPNGQVLSDENMSCANY